MILRGPSQPACFCREVHPSQRSSADYTSIELQDLLELTPKKDVLFIIGDWNAKVGSQETPGVTGKFGHGVRNEAGQKLIVLPGEHTGYSKHRLPTTQEKTLLGAACALLTAEAPSLP